MRRLGPRRLSFDLAMADQTSVKLSAQSRCWRLTPRAREIARFCPGIGGRGGLSEQFGGQKQQIGVLEQDAESLVGKVCPRQPFRWKTLNYCGDYNVKIVIAVLALAASIGFANAASVIKVPCRDMGDGRTLLAGSFLPDGASAKILAVRRGYMDDMGWANRICTVRVR
jgi:hypothetical protein